MSELVIDKTKSKGAAKSRLDFRIASDNKALIEQAAILSGQTVSDFAASTLLDKAHQIIERHQITKLSNTDRDIFLAMLDNPPQPNEALKNAVKNFRQKVKR